MTKTKTQKEILSSVREAPLMNNYDLSLVDPREYAAPLNVLFGSSEWKDLFIRRNKLYRAAATGDRVAFKQMDQLDKKVGKSLLDVMVKYAMQKRYQDEGKIITLNEYFNDFVRTDEQHQLYDEFSNTIDSAMVLADLLDSMMNDAFSTLKKLDPSCVLSEFDSIKGAMKALGSFSHIHHRNENPELYEVFEKNAEECEEYLRMKTNLFVQEYKKKHNELEAKGKLEKKTIKKLTDRAYCVDLLSNHFFIEGDTAGKREEANKKAKKVIDLFSEDEIKELMPSVLALYNYSESIHQAKRQRNAYFKTLPQSEVTKKVVDNLLSLPKDKKPTNYIVYSIVKEKSALKRIVDSCNIGKLDSEKGVMNIFENPFSISYCNEKSGLYNLIGNIEKEIKNVEEGMTNNTFLANVMEQVQEYKKKSDEIEANGTLEEKMKKNLSDRNCLSALLFYLYRYRVGGYTCGEIEKKVEETVDSFSDGDLKELMPSVMTAYYYVFSIFLSQVYSMTSYETEKTEKAAGILLSLLESEDNKSTKP